MELKDYYGHDLKPNTFYKCNGSHEIIYWKGSGLKRDENKELYLEVEDFRGKRKFYSLGLGLCIMDTKELDELEKIVTFIKSKPFSENNKPNLSEQKSLGIIVDKSNATKSANINLTPFPNKSLISGIDDSYSDFGIPGQDDRDNDPIY